MMTDTELTENSGMENLDAIDSTGNISSTSKDSEVENVDAIKKYIEEQESFLKQSSTANDTLNKSEKSEVLKQVHSERTTVSQSQDPLPSDILLDLENEEDLAKEAAENLLSLSQNCLKMQANINEPQHLNEVIQNNAQELILESNVDVVSKIEDSSEKVENNQEEGGSNISDAKNIELNSNNNLPKNSENNQHFSMNDQIKPQDNSDSIEKSKLKSYSASDLETKNILNENDYSDRPNLLQQLLTSPKVSLVSELNKSDEFKHLKHEDNSEETLAIATSVMDMILNDTETAINKKKVAGIQPKQCSPEKANSSVSLAIGSKVEAKDFRELWHPAQIIEVDCEEMEVLVQYDNQPKMHNEWINISSPRLRPLSSLITKPMSPSPTPVPESNAELKVEDKQKLTFAIGERCLARWRDNRRFIATIQSDLGNGTYEVMFDDGFIWTCPLSRLYKLKESGKHDYPRFGAGPSPAAEPAAAAPPATNGLARLPAFHTHLFDPTRDYLGSKSERREMKRKLNIKEIFNIGQKRKKMPKVYKEPKDIPVCIKEEIKSEPMPDTPDPEPVPEIKPPATETSSTLEVKKAVKRKPPVKKKTLAGKKIELKTNMKPELSLNVVKKEIPEAVASIIGTVCKTEPEIVVVKLESSTEETKDSNGNDIKPDEHTKDELANPLHVFESLEKRDTDDLRKTDVVKKDEMSAEIFSIQDGIEHEEVIGKIKKVITKLEDGINEVEKNDAKPVEIKEEPEEVQSVKQEIVISDKEQSKLKKPHSKIKKGKKLRLMQEKKVKKQVAKAKCQLEEMKKQVEAMRHEMIMLKTGELKSRRCGPVPAPESCLLPGEWCCRWVDGQPVGAVSEVECDLPAAAAAAPPLPRRSVQVEDKRLPPGWTKHMVRRSLGNSAGKWDVVLVSPENRRMHTKHDMRMFLENNPDESLKPFKAALMDFGVHLKLSRRMGWVGSSAEGAPPPPAPSAVLANTSPLLKRQKLSLKKNHDKLKHHQKHKSIKIKLPRLSSIPIKANEEQNSTKTDLRSDPCVAEEATLDGASIKDGFVYVGSLKVQVIETLLRCPAERCFKNFRNTMLLKMHIKHYHRELRKTMGNTPKVLDLAYARTRPTEAEITRLKCEAQQRIVKVKLPRLHKREEHVPIEMKDVKLEPAPDPPPVSPAVPEEGPKPQDSPKLRNALVNKPAKRPKVLLPVRNKEPEPAADDNFTADLPIKSENVEEEKLVEPKQEIPDCGVLDFETAISTHTVTKLVNGTSKVKSEKKRKTFACIPKLASEDEDWGGSDLETRSSYPSCSTPDSKATDVPAADDHKDPDSMYMYTENGERIKLVRMKREEIINCHCGFREEDGLMVQCELCLCWQHALCHNIQRESEVPEKYTCSICLSPRRGRRRQRFMHDQDRLYEGLLPGPGGGRACDALRRAHELSGNLLRVEDALHAVRVNAHVARTKNHPKLYLWARDWESVELSFAQEKLSSEYSDLNVIINNLGKENLPIKVEDLKEMAIEMKPTPSDELEEKYVQKENQTGPQALLSGLVSSPIAASLDLPISDSDLEKLAKSVQGHVVGAARAPVPEAAIENGACRARLLRHLQRCHALLDQRLDSIEAQVAELESQDALLEDDETANFYPRTKQTMQMISRDLDAMEELGIVTSQT